MRFTWQPPDRHQHIQTVKEHQLRKLCACTLLLLSAVAASLAAQSELWEKATALAPLAKSYFPQQMTSVAEELNRDGTRKTIVETIMTISYDSKGKVQRMELTQAFRDGKDVTDEMKKNIQSSKNQNTASAGATASTFGFNGMLFDEESSKKIHLLPGAAWIDRDGKHFGSIPFELDIGPLKMKGTAEIDPQGIPSVARTKAQFLFVKDSRFHNAIQ